jgi:hypothetical protein
MELANSHEPRASLQVQRRLVAQKCTAVSSVGRWLVQWNGRCEPLPDSDGQRQCKQLRAIATLMRLVLAAAQRLD